MKNDRWLTKWIIGCLTILAAVFLFAMVVGSSGSKPEQTQVYDLYELTYTELENGRIYRADELWVVDCFAQTTVNGKIDTMYYLVIYRDYNGRIIAANMPVKDSDSIYWKLLQYSSDETAQIGDCVLDCYVRTRQNSTGDSNNAEMRQYFSEAVEQYSAVFGDTLIPLELALSYHCDSSADPLAK